MLERWCLYRNKLEEIRVNRTGEPNLFNLVLFRLSVLGAFASPFICICIFNFLNYFYFLLISLETFICTYAPLYLGSTIMIKRAVNAITAIKYYVSFSPFILRSHFPSIFCEVFLSVSGVIPCSVVHQPCSSYNAAVKFVVLKFSSLLKVPCQTLGNYLLWLPFTSLRMRLRPVCKLFKAGFPITPQRYEKYSSYSQVSYSDKVISPFSLPTLLLLCIYFPLLG